MESAKQKVSCPKCGSAWDSLESLVKHTTRTHQISSRTLWGLLNGAEPKCPCGCGETPKFLNVVQGFREFKRGHVVRMPGRNSWGNNPVAQENSLGTRREMLREGTWKPFHSKDTGEHWGLDLTKETDPRIAKMAENCDREGRSVRMKKAWADGKIRPMKGPESTRWKGGISSLGAVCHSNPRLYREWKFPLLKAANFKCQRCESTLKLQVHHNEEQFSPILRAIALKLGWTDQLAVQSNFSEEKIALKNRIADEVAAYHVDNKVSGEVVCRQCHQHQHPNLNFNTKKKGLEKSP